MKSAVACVSAGATRKPRGVLGLWTVWHLGAHTPNSHMARLKIRRGSKESQEVQVHRLRPGPQIM